MTDTRIADALVEALSSLARWPEAVQVPYAVIGGVAIGLQAIPRTTRDIDAVIFVDDDRWSSLIESASAFGITPRQPDAPPFAQRTRVLLLEHESGVPLDVSCGALPFELEVVEQAEAIDVGAFSQSRVVAADARHIGSPTRESSVSSENG